MRYIAYIEAYNLVSWTCVCTQETIIPHTLLTLFHSFLTVPLTLVTVDQFACSRNLRTFWDLVSFTLNNYFEVCPGCMCIVVYYDYHLPEWYYCVEKHRLVSPALRLPLGLLPVFDKDSWTHVIYVCPNPQNVHHQE